MLTFRTSCGSKTMRRERGQNLVEFALVLTFIILPFTMVFIEASVILYEYVALTNAAREGARAGAIYLYVGDPGGSTTVPDAGRSEAVAEAVGDTVGPLVSPPPDCGGAGSITSCQITYGPSSAPIPDPLRSTDALTVTLVHTHSFLFGALGNEMTMRAHSSMRIEPSSVISGTGP
jgi:hypothetical protein